MLSSLTLAIAAYSDVADPVVAGRHALVVAVSDLAHAVTGEWLRFADGARPQTFGVRPEQVAALCNPPIESADPTDLSASAPAAQNDGARTLMRDAAARASADDPVGALDSALAAVAAASHPEARANARILAASLARQAERPDVLRAQLEAAHTEMAWSDAIGDTSARLLIHLLCIEYGDSELASSARDQAIEAWRLGQVALPSPAARVHRGPDGRLIARITPAVQILADRLAHADGSLSPTLQEALSDARARALLDAFNLDLRAAADPSFVRAADNVLMTLHDPSGQVKSFSVPLPRLIGAFRQFLAAGQIPSEGFTLDFNQDPPSPGELLRRDTLPDSVDLAFAIRHPHVAAFRADPGQRARILRAALLAMAVFSLGAGLATHAAIVRRRRLEALQSAFIANTSHELRTPLSSILLMAENLENGVVRSKEGLARYHALIRQEASRLRRLVDDVLDFARHERGAELSLTLVRLDSQLLFDRAEQLIRERAEISGATVVVTRSGTPRPLRADLDALLRCIANLIENAFVHGGGDAVLCFASDPDALVICVSDHGRGIPAARRDAVFRAFVRLDPDAGRRGTGLGLTIVHAIVRAHDGAVSVFDSATGGAEFQLRLPWAEPSARDGEMAASGRTRDRATPTLGDSAP